MGGAAIFAGTNHQAGVIAYVFVNMLTFRRLGWLAPTDDTPIAVSAETGGAGDDIRIELGEARTFEVQAKAGLTGEAALADAVRAIVRRAGDDPLPVILVVDRRSSRWIYREFATELERIRDGRLDILSTARDLYAELGETLEHIRVKAVDVSPPDDPEAKQAIDLLAGILADPSFATSAWALLLEFAADVAARRLRKDRSALVELLTGAGIAVRALSADDRWLAQLEFVRQLLERWHAAAALSVLGQLSVEIDRQVVGADIRYWLARHRATAHVQLGRPAEALASAREALDIRPQGREALTSATIAALRMGDTTEARTHAEAAIAAAPDDPKAWGALAQVLAAAGEAPREAPAEVAASTQYRTVLAEIAMAQGQPERARELTGLILEVGDRTPESLFLRAAALIELLRDPMTAETGELADIERLATEAIDGLDDVHPFKARALVVRAAARQAHGGVDDAEEDLQLASSLDPRDVNVLRHLVSLRLAADEDQRALELLYRPIAADDALLLALRVQVLTRLGRRDEARRDLDRTVALIADAENVDAARLATAEAAIELGEFEMAAIALEGLRDAEHPEPFAGVLRGRLAFAEGRIEDGIARYRAAADAAGPQRSLYLAELAVALGRVSRDGEAIAVFDSIDLDEMPEEPRRAYVVVLMRSSDFTRAQAQVDALAGTGPLPPWALGVAVDIALAREDSAAAIAHLIELVDRGHGTAQVRITLARAFLESDRATDAATQADALLGDSTLTPVERMQVAEVLRELGRGEEAIGQALAAFRQGRDDPGIHRALVGMVFASRIRIPEVDTVDADTVVGLRDEHGGKRRYTILTEPPYRPSQNELDMDGARMAGLLGLRMGGTLVEHEGTWQEKRWTVEEIVPAVVAYARDALAHYEPRFGEEPFFAAAIHLGDDQDPAGYAKLIQALMERRDHADTTFALVREQGMPLGMVIRILGGSIADVMEAATVWPDGPRSLSVEWEDATLRAWSADQARAATAVIVTRSGIETISELGVGDAVRAGYELVAPRSLIDELRSEVAEARDQVQHGRSTIGGGDFGIRLEELQAGHPVLVERLARLEALLAWVTAATRIEPRPLEWIKADDASPTSLRQIVGRSSYDALVLVEHFGAALHADDLGLRRLALRDERPSSFSSASLLPVLAERGLIDAELRDAALVSLAVRGFVFVPPSAGLLVAALHRTPALTRTELERAFALLGSQAVIPSAAAKVSALACRAVAIETVQVVSPVLVAELSLEALAVRVPRPLAATLLAQAAAETMALLPQHLDAVRDACVRFGRS